MSKLVTLNSAWRGTGLWATPAPDLSARYMWCGPAAVADEDSAERVAIDPDRRQDSLDEIAQEKNVLW
jgi:hypothetical protein